MTTASKDRGRQGARPRAGLDGLLVEPLPPIWMLLGKDAFSVQDAVGRVADFALRDGLAAFNRSEGSAEEGAIPSLIRQAATMPMMGDRRVVIVKTLEKAPARDLTLLMDYVASPSTTTVFLMTGSGTPPAAEGSDPGRRLQNLVKKTGIFLSFDPEDTNPVEFASARASAGGVRLDANEAAFLVELVGRDLGAIASEVDKLVAYMGGEGRASLRDIEEICSVQAEAVIWDLTDAIVRRDVSAALAITHRMLEEGEAPQRILPLVAWQMRQLLVLQDCDAKGENPFQCGLRMPSAKLSAARNSLRARPLRAARLLGHIADANKAMHGHAMGERRVLEALVLRLVSQ